MEKYDYRAHMIEDIKNYIQVNEIDWKNEPYLYDMLWEEDEITGNAGGYYASEQECEEYVCHNLDLYFEAAREFDSWPKGFAEWTWRNPAQVMDCTIRCYLLWQAADHALEELRYEDSARNN